LALSIGKKEISKKPASAPNGGVIKTISSEFDNWKYGKSNDTQTEFAYCKSINFLEIGRGSSSFQLVIRKVGKDDRYSTVYINLLNSAAGGFVTNQKEYEIVTLEFDNDKPMEVSFVSPADVPSDIIYLKSFKKIMAKLRTSKKLKIKVEFRNVGWKFINFDVSNIKL
jgi:hypothetical protein